MSKHKNSGRNLTLNEKITIKGILARYGVLRQILVRLDIDYAIYLLWACAHISIKDYAELGDRYGFQSNVSGRR